jgi:hypothetical protein
MFDRRERGPLDLIFDRDDRPHTAPLDLIFSMAGNGRGAAGQVRLWSAIVLVLFGGMTIAGAYMYAQGTIVELPAAAIEDGYRPAVRHWTDRRGRRPNPYQIVGHLDETGGGSFERAGARWRCAPVLSGRAGSEQSPRVYYAAPERHYYSARAARRFVGTLYAAPMSPVWSDDDLQRIVPYEAYLLFDDGTQAGAVDTARSIFIIGAVITSIAGVAFLLSLRKQEEEEADATSPPAPQVTEN